MWFFGSAPTTVEEEELVPPGPTYGPPCALCEHSHEVTVADPTDRKHTITYVTRCGECGCVANGNAYAGVAA